MADTNGKSGFKITELWAWIADQDGEEGVIGANLGGQWMPLIMADEARCKSMRPLAEESKKLSPSTPIKLVKFTQRVDLETL